METLMNKHEVDASSYEWEEGDKAIVLRYRPSMDGPEGNTGGWDVISLRCVRHRDGLLRWKEGVTLHKGTKKGGYREAVSLSKQSAQSGHGLVPVFVQNEDRSVAGNDIGGTLVAQWRHGDYPMNRKNTILRALKEDV